MTILREVLAELIGMFVGDARLSAAILAVVVLAALLIEVGHVLPLIGGVVLLAGCLAVVVTSVRRGARRAAAQAAGGPAGPASE
jgi:hypothetical protein